MSWEQAWEKLQEIAKEKQEMSKLLNGQPYSELKSDPVRFLVALWRDGTVTVARSDDLASCTTCTEWAEILKPEPKADANGWWKLSDKNPDNKQFIVFCHLEDKQFGKPIFYNADIGHSGWSHWKPFDGPVE